ncbi:hypothetical protein IMAU30156_00860 [Lactobacillus helveticus]|nr:hypothetical protein [Lactobacillus helveticus]
MGSGTGKKITSKVMSKANKLFTKNRQSSSDIKLIGLINNKRDYRFIARDYLQDNKFIDKFKVMIPKANGSGAIGEVISTPLVGEPLVGGTDTFISLGPVSTLTEANAILKYVKCKFGRALLGVRKITQDNPKSTWQYVPLQDFTSKSDIDWTKSIPEIDQQLYKKYNLSDDEINFIETKVQAME